VIIGNGLRMHTRLDIRGAGMVLIGRDCVIDGACGDSHQFVTLYTLNPHATITIGNHVRLCAARISSRFSVNIGNNAIIEESGIADTDFHTLEKSRELPSDERIEDCQIMIGDRVLIGPRSIITKGVSIGSDVVVGPGAIVIRSLPARAFALGNPAKIVKIIQAVEPGNEKCRSENI